VLTITDPRSGVTTFTYDTVGNLTNLRDGLSNDTSWTYDGLNRVTQETNELNESRYFVYDAAGNLLRQTDRNERVTRYAYDSLDRLTEELWIDSGSPTPSVGTATTTQGGATSEVQRVGFTGSSLFGGTFTLTYDGQTTSGIAYNASAATVQAALEALSNVDPGEVGVVMTFDTFSKKEWQLTFQGDLAGTNVAQTTIDTSSVVFVPSSEIEATDTQGSGLPQTSVPVVMRV
jgi:YD repeat-containing protein